MRLFIFHGVVWTKSSMIHKLPNSLQILSLAVMLTVLTSLAGCSARLSNYAEFVKFAASDAKDVTLSQSEIEVFPYAAQYIQFTGQPRALMALAFDDKGTLKWRTGGDEIIITRYGRMVGSVNMSGAVAHTSHLAQDPLACLVKNIKQTEQCATRWERQIWVSSATVDSLHDQAFKVLSEFRVGNTQNLSLPNGSQVTVTHIEESLQVFDDAEPHEFTNEFWLENSTGRVVKSTQFISPQVNEVTIEEVKAYIGNTHVQ